MNGKWIYLAQRNPRFTREQFAQRWLKHRTLGAQPAMRAEFATATYCAVKSSSLPLDGLSDEYDAVGLFALASLGSIPLVAQNLKNDYAQADEKRFFTTTADNFSMFCAENILREGDYTKTVVVQFLRRPADLGPTDFAKKWREAHAPVVRESPAFKPVRQYIQNVMIAPPPPGFGYSGIAEFWFDSEEAVAAAASDLNRLMASDFIDPKNSFCLLTEVIITKPRT